MFVLPCFMIYSWCVVDELLDCLYCCLGAKLWMLQ